MGERVRFSAILWVGSLLLATAMFLSQPTTNAQGGVGELTGVVYDPAGATVSGARIKLTNASTGFDREMETGAGGVYRFTALTVVGTYTLSAEHAGFRKSQVPGIVISVGTVATIDVHLELGAATESITVEAGSEL